MYFLGSRISVGVGVPIAAAAGMISKFGLEFDKAMTESLAIMDEVSPKLRKQMEDTAKSLVDNTKFSAEEGAKGYYELASAGLSAEQSMAALPTVAKFAQAGVMDLDKATQYLTTSQIALGLASDDAAENQRNMARVADVLTEANNRAVGTVEDFAKALAGRAAGALREHNKSVEEGVAVLTAYADVGIKGQKAGTYLYMMMRDLETQALRHAAAFRQANIAVFDQQGQMRNLADVLGDVETRLDGMSDKQKKAQLEALGLRDRSSAAIVSILGMSDAIRQMQSDLEKAGGATERVANTQMKALENELLQLYHKGQNVAIDVFSKFKPVIEQYFIPAAEKGIELLKSLGDWFGSLSTPTQAFLALMLSIPVVLGPVVASFGGFLLLVKAGIAPFSSLLNIMSDYSVASRILGTSLFTMGARASEAFEVVDAGGNVLRTFEAGTVVATGRLTLFSGALALLSNPITQIALAVTAVGAATYLWYTRQTELEKEFSKDAKTFRDHTSTLQKQLETYQSLVGQEHLTKQQREELDRATRGLAEASGLSKDAFEQEMKNSNDLTNALYAQLRARQELMKAQVSNAMDAEARAASTLKELQGRLDLVQSGKGTKTVFESGLGDRGTMMQVPLSLTERKAEVDRLKAAIAAAELDLQDKKRLVSETSGLSRVTGDIFLGPEKAKPKTTSPPVEPTLGSGTVDAVTNLYHELAGTGSKDLSTLEAAWRKLSAEQQADNNVLDRVWEKYSKIRDVLGAGVSPELERVTAQNVEFVDWLHRVESSQAYEKYFGQLTEGNATTREFIKYQDMISSNFTQLQITGGDVAKFFRTHDQEFQELLKDYNQLPPDIQRIVDAYLKWKQTVTEFSSEHQAAIQKAGRDLAKIADETNATLQDKLTERTLFSRDYADAELANLKKGLAKEELTQKQHYADALKAFSVYAAQADGATVAAGLKQLNEIKANGELIIETERRIGLLRLLQSDGVSKQLLRNERKYTDEQLENIHRQLVAWDEFIEKQKKVQATLSAVGELFTTIGGPFSEIGSMITGVEQGVGVALDGIDEAGKAMEEGDLAGTITGITKAAMGAIQAFQSLGQVGSRSMRALGGAMAGAQIGTAIMPGYGTLIGMGIGALVGALKADPGWKKAQQTVQYHWNAFISKPLADQIDKDSKMLGGHVNSMLLHLSDVANESGGLSAQNVDQWAMRLGKVFDQLAMHQITAANAAKVLDANFDNLVQAGTGVSGLLDQQVSKLVALTRQYGLTSEAVSAFVSGQVSNVQSGFNALAAGFAAPLNKAFDLAADGSDTLNDSVDKLSDKQQKLLHQVQALEQNTARTAEQETQLRKSREDLLVVTMQLGEKQGDWKDAMAELANTELPELQGRFNQMGIIAVAAFAAAVSSGQSVIDVLGNMGEGLDSLNQLAANFHLDTSQIPAFQDLLGLRDFMKQQPEVIAAVDGLNKVLTGLANISMLDQDTFEALEGQAEALFKQMTDGGLSSQQALLAMQPALQTIWELQHNNHMEVDETTQALLDQAEAAGIVGSSHQSAMDRIAEATERLVEIFETVFADKLPKAVQDGVDQATDQLDRIPRHVDVKVGFEVGEPRIPGGSFEPDIPQYATGARVTTPHVAVVGDADETILPDRYVPQLAGTIASYMPDSGSGSNASATSVETLSKRLDALVDAIEQLADSKDEVTLVFQGPTDGASVARFVKSKEFAEAWRQAKQTDSYGAFNS
jgi:TP901 family phage tail tape measure protein